VTTYELEAAGGVAAEGNPALQTVVMKFGGPSVGDPDRITQVARRLVAARARGARVVAVVSAMGHATDELIELAREVSPNPAPRELDMLLSAGERISCALLAMAINDLGREAVSLTGSQAGIITDGVHTRARIVEVRAKRIHEALDTDQIVLVAGFQGMSEARDITTLGRGGADMTAVALAAALSADACEIYTDVDGIFTADPRIVADARKLDILTFEEMLELAASGAEVLPLRSVEFARNHGVPLHVRSTSSEQAGTWITEEDERVEKAIISGVAHTLDEAVYRVQGTTPATLFAALAEKDVSVDTIVQTGADVIVFSAPLAERGATAGTLEDLGAIWSERADLAKVSLVGAGMKNHPGIAARTFATLRDLRIEPQFISTSPIKIAFYVHHADVERAVRALHAAFELGSETARERS
jgi:aspartate kinase